MFETLFTYPLNLARHRTAPCPETRESFLVHCAEQGYPHASLKKNCMDLIGLFTKHRFMQTRSNYDQGNWAWFNLSEHIIFYRFP